MQPVHLRPMGQVFQMANVTWSCCTIANWITCSSTLMNKETRVYGSNGGVEGWVGGANLQNSIWTALIVGKGFPYYVQRPWSYHLNYVYHTSIRKPFTSTARGFRSFHKTSFPYNVRLAFRVDWKMCVWMSWRARISFLRAQQQLGSWMYILIQEMDGEGGNKEKMRKCRE